MKKILLLFCLLLGAAQKSTFAQVFMKGINIIIPIGQKGWSTNISAQENKPTRFSDVTVKIINLDFGGGWGFPNTWRSSWNKFETTGLGVFLGTRITDKNYGSDIPPYRFGVYANISYTLLCAGPVSFAIAGRPTFSTTISNQNQRGLTYANHNRSSFDILAMATLICRF